MISLSVVSFSLLKGNSDDHLWNKACVTILIYNTLAGYSGRGIFYGKSMLYWLYFSGSQIGSLTVNNAFT